jgi:hypothetical protein
LVETELVKMASNFSEREKRFLGIGALMAVGLVFLLARSPSVVVMPASPPPPPPAAAPEVPVTPVAANISPVTRAPLEYKKETMEALKLQGGDLEIGRLMIYIDPETRCQYIRAFYRDGLTPRLRKDGHPWCD